MKKNNKRLGMLLLPSEDRVNLNRIESYRPFRRSDIRIRTFSADSIEISFETVEERNEFLKYLDEEYTLVVMEDAVPEKGPTK